MLLRENLFLAFFVAAALFVVIDKSTPHIDRYWEMNHADHGRHMVKHDGKIGYINGRGSLVIPYKYTDGARYFKEGLSPISEGGGWGYIDTYGEQAEFFGEYVWAQPFSNGFAAVASKNRKEVLPAYGFIDEKGREKIPLMYQQVRSFSADGVAAVRVGLKWGYIDPRNEFVIKPQYDQAFDFNQGLAVVVRDGKWGYIDRIGLPVIALQFEEARDFHEGLAAVKSKGVWGFMDVMGKWVVEPSYVQVEDFSDGKALVKGLDGFGFIDLSGKMVMRSVEFSEARSFHEGLAAVRVSPSSKGLYPGKWGYIDHTGRISITPQFDRAFDFEGGFARIGVGPNDLRSGYVHPNGKLVWDPADWFMTKNSLLTSTLFILALVMAYIYLWGGYWRRRERLDRMLNAQKEQLKRGSKDPFAVL